MVAPLRVGFIGLGMMGMPMAGNLARAGHSLIVHDLDPKAVERFRAAHPGAVGAATPADFAPAQVVVLMLPDSNVVDATVLGRDAGSGLAGVLGKGATIVDMSSSEPVRSQALARELATRAIGFVDAPVSGGVKKAIDGSLAIMVGGSADAFAAQLPLLQAMGKTITHVGPAGAGHAVKALNNYVSAAGLLAACEALVAARRFGLDPALVNQVINASTGRNNTTENKVGPFMLSGRFDSGFSLQLMAKDLGIAMGLGRSVGQDMAMGEQVLALWREAADAFGRPADHTEMFRFVEGRSREPGQDRSDTA